MKKNPNNSKHVDNKCVDQKCLDAKCLDAKCLDNKCLDAKSMHHGDHDETNTECAYINKEDVDTNIVNKKLSMLLKQIGRAHV